MVEPQSPKLYRVGDAFFDRWPKVDEGIITHFPNSLMGSYFAHTEKSNRTFETVAPFIQEQCASNEEKKSKEFDCIVGLRTGDVLDPQSGKKWIQKTPPDPKAMAETLAKDQCSNVLFVTGKHKGGETATQHFLKDLEQELTSKAIDYSIKQTGNVTTEEIDEDLCLLTNSTGVFYQGQGGFHEFVAGVRSAQGKESKQDFVGKKNDLLHILHGYRARPL